MFTYLREETNIVVQSNFIYWLKENNSSQNFGKENSTSFKYSLFQTLIKITVFPELMQVSNHIFF